MDYSDSLYHGCEPQLCSGQSRAGWKWTMQRYSHANSPLHLATIVCFQTMRPYLTYHTKAILVQARHRRNANTHAGQLGQTVCFLSERFNSSLWHEKHFFLWPLTWAEVMAKPTYHLRLAEVWEVNNIDYHVTITHDDGNRAPMGYSQQTDHGWGP